MIKGISLKFKILLVFITIVPALFVCWTYLLHTSNEFYLIGSTSNPNVSCRAEANLSDTNQCATWAGTGGSELSALIPFIMLGIELIIAAAIFVALKNGNRLMLLPKMLLVITTICMAPIIAMTVNALAQPHSQQSTISVSKKNGTYPYVVDKQPILGFGPLDIEVFVLFSLAPAIGLIGGALGTAVNDQRKFAGMSKHTLFQ